jgi:hypothetical protein
VLVADVARLDMGSDLGASGWVKNYSVISTRHSRTGRAFCASQCEMHSSGLMAFLSSCLLP